MSNESTSSGPSVRIHPEDNYSSRWISYGRIQDRILDRYPFLGGSRFDITLSNDGGTTQRNFRPATTHLVAGWYKARTRPYQTDGEDSPVPAPYEYVTVSVGGNERHAVEIPVDEIEFVDPPVLDSLLESLGLLAVVRAEAADRREASAHQQLYRVGWEMMELMVEMRYRSRLTAYSTVGVGLETNDNLSQEQKSWVLEGATDYYERNPARY